MIKARREKKQKTEKPQQSATVTIPRSEPVSQPRPPEIHPQTREPHHPPAWRHEAPQERKQPETARRQEPPARPFVDNYDLPSSYGQTRLTLMVKDPHWVHAYWEVAPSTVESVRQQIGDQFDRSSYVLRMNDIKQNEAEHAAQKNQFDIEVGPHSSSWYINLWADNAAYQACLGVKTPNGDFIPMAQSNSIETPRGSFSQRSDIMWMEVKDTDRASAPFAIGNIRSGKAKKASGKNGEAQSAARRKRRVYLTEDDIRVYYGRLSPLLADVVSQRPGRDLRREHSARKGTRLFLSLEDRYGLTIEEVLKRGYIKKILSGSSEEILFVGASESVVGVGGASEFVEQRRRKFFFEIGTELIVYGRTEPDAEVWLGDKKVPLRQDGTFGMRFALPDGKIPLHFTAISNDKVETRTISTIVERTTKHGSR